MKIIKIIVFMLVLFIFFSCNSKDNGGQDLKEGVNVLEQEVNPFPDYINLVVTNPETAGFRYPKWDGVLDERVFDPLDSTYPRGSVKEMKVWAAKIKDDGEKELFIIKEYDSEGKISRIKRYNHGDESGWNYFYDDYGIPIIVEETFNGVIVPERQITYQYLPFDSDENKVVRKVSKNNKLIQIETEQIIGNIFSLEIDFTDKRTTVTDSLYFENNNVIKYINDSGPRFRYISKFRYENNTLMKLINLNSKEEKMFVHDYKYDKDGYIVEGITHDYRDNPPTIMRTQKAMNHDQHGNWLRKELYEDEIMVAYIEREITYY